MLETYQEKLTDENLKGSDDFMDFAKAECPLSFVDIDNLGSPVPENSNPVTVT